MAKLPQAFLWTPSTLIFFHKNHFTAMQTQTNTTQNLTDTELVNTTGGDGYAPSNPAQDPTGSNPQQAAEELIKLTTGVVYY